MFLKLSIKNKLIAIIIMIALLSTLIGEVIDLSIRLWDRRTATEEKGIMDANLIGEYCIMPLEFDDKDRAKEVMMKLAALPYIKLGVLFDRNGKVFSTYTQNGFVPQQEEYELKTKNELTWEYIYIYESIEYEGEVYGTVHLQVDTNIAKIISRHLLFSLLVFLAMVGVAVFMAMNLEKIISRPILALADFTNQIADTKDYSKRISKTTEDEIGMLYDRYNNLLDNLQRWESERDIAVDALAASERKFRAIIDNAGSLIYLKDRAGKHLLVNKLYLQTFSLDPNNVIGKTDSELYGEQFAADFRANDLKVWKTKEVLTKEEELYLGGKQKTYLSVKFPLHDAEGKMFAVCGISTDISEKRIIQEVKTINACL